jgi:hypothetical protein
VWSGAQLMGLDLLGRCTRAADADAALPDSFEPQYRWVTHSQMLVVPYRGELDRAYLLDTALHKRTPLSGLLPHLSLDDRKEAMWELSPDRSWLAWSVEGSKFVRTAHLDGSGFQSVAKPRPKAFVEVIYWQDPGTWAAATSDIRRGTALNAFYGHVTGPPTTVIRDVPDIAELGKPFWRVSASGSEDIRIPVWRGADEKSPDYRTLVGPRGAQITDAAIDGSHRRVAALTLSTRTRPFAAWIGRFWPDYAVPVTYAGLWTSPIDHEAWQAIGSIAVDKSAIAPPSDLRWLPSDKRLSFMYHGAIWTIQAD